MTLGIPKPTWSLGEVERDRKRESVCVHVCMFLRERMNVFFWSGGGGGGGGVRPPSTARIIKRVDDARRCVCVCVCVMTMCVCVCDDARRYDVRTCVTQVSFAELQVSFAE